MDKNNIKDKTFAGRFLVGARIGSGSFGEVFLVNLLETGELYAMKNQNQKAKYPQLIAQARLLKTLKGIKGFPSLIHYGNENKVNYLVMEMLGPSLEDLFVICKKSFSLKTILMLAIQIIKRIEVLHSKNYIHRDIKPQNFLMGTKQNSQILHLIDFGLSKKYRDPKTHQHIYYKQGKSLAGTVRFSSINTHLGIQQSRRDDLESIGYLLLFFLKGCLPWQGLLVNSKADKHKKILQMKMSIPVQILFKDNPIEFSTYMHYCRSLKFEQRPDYSFLKKLFRDLLQRLGYEMDYVYDWCKLAQLTQLQKQQIGLNIYTRQSTITDQIIGKASKKHLLPSKFSEVSPIDMQRVESRVTNDEKKEIISQGQNIDSQLLQETDMKLLSSRNPWSRYEQV